MTQGETMQSYHDTFANNTHGHTFTFIMIQEMSSHFGLGDGVSILMDISF